MAQSAASRAGALPWTANAAATSAMAPPALLIRVIVLVLFMASPRLDVLGRHVPGDHEAVGALELEGLGPHAIGFDLVGHQDEAVVAWDADVLQVLDDDGLVGHAGEALQPHLGRLAAVQQRVGAVLARLPGVDGALGGGERLPVARVGLPDDGLHA